MDENPGVRKVAAEALGWVRDPRSVEPLIHALKTDGDLYVRKTVIWALGNLNDRRSIKPLIESLKDEDISIKIEAAKVLGRFNDPRLLVLLNQVLKEDVDLRPPNFIPSWCLPRELYSEHISEEVDSMPMRMGIKIHQGVSKEFCESNPGCKLFTKKEFEKLWPIKIAYMDTALFSMSPCRTHEDRLSNLKKDRTQAQSHLNGPQVKGESDPLRRMNRVELRRRYKRH